MRRIKVLFYFYMIVLTLGVYGCCGIQVSQKYRTSIEKEAAWAETVAIAADGNELSQEQMVTALVQHAEMSKLVWDGINCQRTPTE